MHQFVHTCSNTCMHTCRPCSRVCNLGYCECIRATWKYRWVYILVLSLEISKTPQCIHTYIHTDKQTYIGTCIHTYINTYIRTYVGTYARTCLHSRMCLCAIGSCGTCGLSRLLAGCGRLRSRWLSTFQLLSISRDHVPCSRSCS